MYVLLSDGAKSGVTPESIKAATASKQMTLQEAKLILGIDSKASYEEAKKVTSEISLLFPKSLIVY